MSSNEQGFYITLPSESSKNLFPENNPSEYTVRLPRWVQLKGNWEIGLHSIAYTPWNIVQHLDEPLSYTYSDNKEEGKRMKKYHGTIQDYITSINKSLSEAPKLNANDEINFAIHNGKVTITLPQGYKVFMRREQAIVLGFMKFDDVGEVKEIEKSETGTYKANLYRETNIHVYCDIVQPQIVGDKMAPLVAIVPWQKITETYEVLHEVENIHHIPVQTKAFQNIKVHLRSSTEESIPFQHGRAAITLHLKPLNYFE